MVVGKPLSHYFQRLFKVYILIMAGLICILAIYIFTYYKFLMVPIVIIHHENISIDIIFVTLLCILSDILKNVFIMAVANLHINNIYLHVTTF